jgi:hypothetical protein
VRNNRPTGQEGYPAHLDSSIALDQGEGQVHQDFGPGESGTNPR